jgi:hypothetical protein
VQLLLFAVKRGNVFTTAAAATEQMALSPCEEDAHAGQLFIIHATQSFRWQVPQDASLVCEEQLLFTSSSYLNDTAK